MGMVHLFTYMESRVDGDCGGGGTGLVDSAYTCPSCPGARVDALKPGKRTFIHSCVNNNLQFTHINEYP